ncbi:TPA: hypothetical protein ROY06_005749 [Bacillus cereus]|uniref:hypothetical protein n=1 Tax=Bacillus thuringiensis TaxID=1428 RepID=UPI000BF9C94A|nr:hypothetical protein [Bacillus thuringiensis]PES39233.1 hypothetical protein CN493_08655 [Bacillus thuringiensis]HDX9512362.1 hypothetical protein [Bacillus cereus]
MGGTIEIIKNICHILFFIVTGIIAILTFIQAKKTVLQPIKTEIFKEQIKELSKILEIFNGKGEYELRKDLDFGNILNINVHKMFDDFATLFYDVEIDRDKRPYAECIGAIVTKEKIGKYVTIADDHLMDETAASKETVSSKPDSKAVHAIWSKYGLPMISITAEHDECVKKIGAFKKNPLIPKPLLNLLIEYEVKISENIKLIDKIIDECAQEMPQKYPNLEKLKNSRSDWIQNKYNSRFNNLEENAESISDYIRDYFKTDELMGKRK